MGLKIDSLEELQEFVQNVGLDISNLEQFREFLETVNDTTDQPPEARKEELAHKERLQERQHAHEERLRTLEHAERLRALELGHPLPDDGDVAKAQSAIRAVGTLATLLALALVGAAGGVSIWILQWTSNSQVSVFGLSSDLQTALFAMVWGVSGLVLLFTLVASLRAIRRVREGASRRLKAYAARPSVSADQPANRSEPFQSSC